MCKDKDYCNCQNQNPSQNHNHNPIANPTSAETPENTPVTVNVLANAFDPDKDILNIIKLSKPSNGTAAIKNGKVVYTPNTNYYGNDSFNYTISDGHGGTVTQTATIKVDYTNHAPNACPTSAETPENTAVTVNVLANARDVDGDTLIVTNVGNPSNGTAAIKNGKVVYTPNTNFYGTDSFKYTISDGHGGTVTQTATIKVDYTNHAPKACPTSAETPENTAVTVDVLAKARDVDGDTLTISNVGNPSNGTAVIKDGKVVYTPNTNYYGNDSFKYTISDGNGGTVTQTATIKVDYTNHAPNACPTSAETPENTPVTVDVLAKARDVDGDTLTISNVGNPSNGTAAIKDGKVVYTPNTNYYGNDSFNYTISDGNGGTVTQTATIKVDYTNHAPNACPTSAETPENTPVTVDVLAKARDVDGDTLTISNVGNPSNGTAAIKNGKVVYTPNTNYYGNDSFNYTISDGNGGTVTQTATIKVDYTNHAPNACPTSAETPENTPVTVDVLAKARDVDGDTLTISNVGNPSNGTAAIKDGKVVYTPNTNYYGNDSFNYTISDGNGGTVTQTATIKVDYTNHAPNACPTSAETPENTPVTVDVLAKARDVDGDTLTISNVGNPSNGTAAIKDGKVVYTPNTNYYGNDSFNYTISDGNGGTVTQTATIKVDYTNHAPNACPTSAETPENTPVTVDVLAKARDVDGDTLTISNVGNPSNGTAAIKDEKVVYTPNTNYYGNDSFNYTISDGNGGTVTQTATIKVDYTNHAPNACPTSAETKENTPVIVNVLANASDADGDTLNICKVTNPANGAVIIKDNQVLYTPNANFYGTDSFTYTISDGHCGTVTQTATIKVDSNVIIPPAPVVAANEYGYLTGDPHLRGGDGELYNINGTTGNVYSVLADSNLAYNAKINPVDQWGNKGATESSITVAGPNSKSVIFYDKTGNAQLLTYQNGTSKEVSIVKGQTYTLADGGTAQFGLALGGGTNGQSLEERLIVTTAEGYIITQVERNGSYIDSNVQTGTNGIFADGQMPSGILGDTFDGNGIARIATNNLGAGVLNHNLSYYDLGTNVNTIALSNLNTPYVLTVNSSSGYIFLTGTNGNDYLQSTVSNTVISSLAGNDYVKNNNANNEIFLGSGNDTVEEHGGQSTIIGGAGNDTIQSLKGNDYIVMGSGNNSIQLSAQNDTVIGGTGINTFKLFGQNNVVNGNLGTVNIEDDAGKNLISLGTGNSNILNWAGSDTIYGGIGNDTIAVQGNNNLIYAGDGNAYVSAAYGNGDTIYGGAGNDTITSQDGSNTIYGGSGNDVISAWGIGDKVIYGGTGNDTITTSSLGNSLLSGGAGNDLLTSNTYGNDTLDGGCGADTMIGGNGNDTFYVDNTSDVVAQNSTYGNSNEVRSTISYTLGQNIQNLTLLGTDNINGTGNDLNNILTGNSGSNILTAGIGNDTIIGGAGNDTLIGGIGSDAFVFNKGDQIDTIQNSSAKDVIQFGSSVNLSQIALFEDSAGNLDIDYGTSTNQDQIVIKNWSTVSSQVSKIELNNGQYITNTDINKLVQEISSFASANGISMSKIDDVKANTQLMGVINSAWHS